MNTKQILIAVAACVAAASSFAGNITEFSDNQYVSTKTRAEVVAELKQARAHGERSQGANSAYPMFSTAKSMKSRADVRQEITQSARQNSNLDYDQTM